MATTWPLIGRDAQLRAIKSAIASPATAGVVLVGASGVGKTRLMSEAVARAAAHGRETAWVVATAASASIPLGPLLHLLPSTGLDPASQLDLLRQVRRDIAERGRGRPLVLAVDDAHLLDDASAALVHHLATARSAWVIVTVRIGEPAPDAITALWKDGIAEWIEVQPLVESEIAALVEAVLGGQVDGGTLHALWELSNGNVLFLRELVTGGLESGALEQVEGVWRVVRPLTTSTRLAETVRARLVALDPEVTAVGEVVAIGEPLSATLLEAVVPAGELEAADRAGLLRVVPDARRTRVCLAHPLYGEFLRSHTSPLRVRAIRQQLGVALRATGARRRDDLLRLAVWQLEGGTTPDPGLLVAASRQATAVFFDHELAERLAAAAVEAGGGFAAKLALANAWHARGRAVEAERSLRSLAVLATTEVEYVRWSLVRASNLLRGLGQSDAAANVVQQAERRMMAPQWRDELSLLSGLIALDQGRPVEADDTARLILDRPNVGGRVALRALAVRVAAAAYRGLIADAEAAAERGIELLGGWQVAPSISADRLLTLLSLARRAAGHLAAGEALATRRYQAAIGEGADDVQAGWALARGELALARGHVETSLRWLREAAVLLRRHITVFGVHGLSWSLGCLAQAAAIAGELDTAQRALDEANDVASDLYVPTYELGRAWLLAAHGHLDEACDAALEAAAHARACRSEAFEAEALHLAVRLGAADRASTRLGELATQLRLPLVAAFAAHAAAAAGADAPGLETAAATFSELGTHLLAAEASAQAASLYRRAGRSAPARAAVGRSQLLLERCGPARTPALLLAGRASALTPREREIAALAARGLPNRRIAEELVLSVRTVENHLHNAYTKLGVADRVELADVLSA